MGLGGHGHSHGDSHGHSHGNTKKRCMTDKVRLSCMLCMTFIFFLVELIVGRISESMALTADSFHMLSDALALTIGLFTTIISTKTSKKNTFGWVRAEVLGPQINSVFLMSLCFGILIEAIERLFTPEPLKDVDLMLYVGILGLIINLAGLFLFGHGHSHNLPANATNYSSDDEDEDTIEANKKCECKEANGSIKVFETNPLVESQSTKIVLAKDRSKSKKKCCAILSSEANMNMRAVFLHVLADALGSVIVIISALLNKFQDEISVPKKLIAYIDPVLCLCLVTLILSSTLPLLKESCLILLQTVPKEIELSSLKKELVEKIHGISNVHELHIWKLSGNKIIATAHVVCHNSAEYMPIAAKIKAFFHKRGIHSTTIQPEFTEPIEGKTDECMVECMTTCIENTCCGTQIIKNKTVSSQLKSVTSHQESNTVLVTTNILSSTEEDTSMKKQ